jgi:hypothetical protein
MLIISLMLLPSVLAVLEENTTNEDEYVAAGNPVQPQYALYMPEGTEAVIDTTDTIDLCNDTAQGGSGTILSVNITWDYYIAGTHSNDQFTLEYGIGTDCNTGVPGSWTTKATLTANSGNDGAHTNSTYNVTGDRSWTWSDITNIWIRVQGAKTGSADPWYFYWDSGFFWVLRSYSTASISSTLWEPTGSGPCPQGDINIGRWGNTTFDPGATNQDSSNFVRVELVTGDAATEFTLDWTPSTWDSATTGDSITIDANVKFLYFETTSTGAGYTGCDWVSGWTDTGSLADGSYTFTFGNGATSYIWIKTRIELVDSPIGVAVDYNGAYTVTLV